MRFEWEESKRESNIVKHGIDFADAPRLFLSPMRTSLDLRQDYGEERFFGLGLLDNRVVAVAFTEPEENTIRVISLRKALAHEKKQYEQYIRQNFGH